MLKSGTGQSSIASFIGLATSVVVCRSGSPNSTRSVRQDWFAAAENIACRPRVPVGVANRFVLGSNQINNELRCLSAAL